jgi:vacuole morphology and inheritance protein 14
MVQNLHNNLVIAPELGDMRRRLKNLDTKDGQALFVSLYNSWCHNAVATFSLCLLAQAYEHASNLLQSLYVPDLMMLMIVGTLKLLCNFSSRWINSFNYSSHLCSLVNLTKYS